MVAETGSASELDASLLSRAVNYADSYIVPGFVDGHLHFPQIGVMASHGAELLEWLEKYTFPEEAKFGDRQYAANAATLFIKELLRNGTTSAMVFPTVHEQSVDAIFTAASAVNMRLSSGKVMMDRNCPENLRDTAASGYEASLRLIEKWHGKNRNSYACLLYTSPSPRD